ncbi:MaoC family dehydratase [Microbacterium betulae]|uniref:MaoC family dehydratase n=1 Tax=Microbacterium betulae TaxID=2981139 RepID=A0AA97FMK8_9MICO|nr:MaoC family dehydratase [Microbacterium sp. AB]
MRVIDGLDELDGAIGTHLGWSGWFEVTQERIDAFAELTGDRQWIHVDPERAARGPFGTTIAHGYLVLALVPSLSAQIYTIAGLRMVVNYGAGRVRFPAPTPAGSRVRVGVELVSLTATPRGHQLVERVTVEREGGGKPVCVAETVALLVPRPETSDEETAHD